LVGGDVTASELRNRVQDDSSFQLHYSQYYPLFQSLPFHLLLLHLYLSGTVDDSSDDVWSFAEIFELDAETDMTMYTAMIRVILNAGKDKIRRVTMPKARSYKRNDMTDILEAVS